MIPVLSVCFGKTNHIYFLFLKVVLLLKTTIVLLAIYLYKIACKRLLVCVRLAQPA